MNKFKKMLALAVTLFFMNSSNALEIIDVQADHWAGQSIINSIQNGYIGIIDNNKFVPNGKMARSEFVSSLLKVISRQNEPILDRTSFKDITEATYNKKSIVLSEQIRMVFGYPDKTFKPNTAINHNEAMSMIANITNNDYKAEDIKYFNDWQDIPLWARRAYIKNVANGLYVNYPDELTFNPSQELTRAEAAVLFDKVAQNLSKIKNDYKDLYEELPEENEEAFDIPKANFISQNTLNLVPFSTNNKVQNYDIKRIIEAGNILIGTSLNITKSRKDYVGDEYIFTAPNDVYTKEGTFLYPKGTEFYAREEKLGYSAWRSRAEKSMVVFHKYSLPNGETYDMAGVPYTKNNKIVYANSLSPKKIKKLTNYKSNQKKYLIDVAHQMAPNIDYKIKNNKTIYILLTADMVIPLSEDYFKLRERKSLLEEDI